MTAELLTQFAVQNGLINILKTLTKLFNKTSYLNKAVMFINLVTEEKSKPSKEPLYLLPLEKKPINIKTNMLDSGIPLPFFFLVGIHSRQG